MACKWEAKWKGTPPTHTYTHKSLSRNRWTCLPLLPPAITNTQNQCSRRAVTSRESASRFLSQYFLITAVQSLVRTRSNTCQNTTVQLWPSALSFYVINYENCSTCLHAKCKESPFVSSSWLADSIVTLWWLCYVELKKHFLVQMETLKQEWRKQWLELTCAEILLLDVRAALQHNYVFSTNYQK